MTDEQALVTLEDVLTQTSRDYPPTDRKAIGMFVALCYRNMTGNEPPKLKIKRKDSSGHPQNYPVAAYPVSFVPIIREVIDFAFDNPTA